MTSDEIVTGTWTGDLDSESLLKASHALMTANPNKHCRLYYAPGKYVEGYYLPSEQAQPEQT